MLIYLLRLLQDTLKKSFAVLIGYRPFWDVPQYLCLTCDTSSKPLSFMENVGVFLVERSIFRQKKLILFKLFNLFATNSRAKLIYSIFIQPLFRVEGKRSYWPVNSHLWSQIFHDINETRWHFLILHFHCKDRSWALHIHFFAKEVTWPIHRPPCRDCSLNWRNWLDTEIYRIADWLGQSFGHQNK